MKVCGVHFPILDIVEGFDGTHAAITKIITLVEKQTPSPSIMAYILEAIQGKLEESLRRQKYWVSLANRLSKLRIRIDGKYRPEDVLDVSGMVPAFTKTLSSKIFDDGMTTEHMVITILPDPQHPKKAIFKLSILDPLYLNNEAFYWRSDSPELLDDPEIHDLFFKAGQYSKKFNIHAAIENLEKTISLKKQFDHSTLLPEHVILSTLIYREQHPFKKWPNAMVKQRIQDGLALNGMTWAAVNERKIGGMTLFQILDQYRKQNPSLMKEPTVKVLKTGDSTHVITVQNVIQAAISYREAHPQKRWPSVREKTKIQDGGPLNGMAWAAINERKIGGLTLSQIIKSHVNSHYKNGKIVRPITKVDVLFSAEFYKAQHPKQKWPTAHTENPIHDGSILTGISWAAVDKRKIDGLSLAQIIQEYKTAQGSAVAVKPDTDAAKNNNRLLLS